MLRALCALVVAGSLTVGAFAQLEARLDDGTTDYTSRGISGTVDGWCFGNHTDIHGGGGVQFIHSWNAVIQDQNCATLDTWRFTIHTEDPVLLYWPDVAGFDAGTSGLGDTGTFLSPAGPSSPCAWIYTMTFTTPVAVDTTGATAFNTMPRTPGIITGNNLFVGGFLPSNALWTGDGTSCHISIVGQGGSQEYPSQPATAFYPPAAGGDPGSYYGVGFDYGTGAHAFSGSWRLWNRHNIRIGDGTGLGEHTVRTGANDKAGVYPTIPAVAPDNFGMAGQLPDGNNGSGVGRADDGVYQGLTSGAGLTAGLAQLFFSNTTLRGLGAPALMAPGIGLIELNLGDPLFAISGAIFPVQPVLGTTTTHRIDLDLLGIRPLMGGPVYDNWYFQEVRLDLATATVSMSNISHQEWLP